MEGFFLMVCFRGGLVFGCNTSYTSNGSKNASRKGSIFHLQGIPRFASPSCASPAVSQAIWALQFGDTRLFPAP